MKTNNSILKDLKESATDFINKNEIRPHSIDSFIGQDLLRNNLKVYIEAAKHRNMQNKENGTKKPVMDHVLLYGPPGLGKTSLANVISSELGSNIKVVSGPMFSKSGDLAAILSNLKNNDVLFIDEIHRLNISIEEILYSAMEDYRLDIIIGEGPSARTIKINLNSFILVGATTRTGLISNPLMTRFGILLQVKFYNVDELSEIIKRAALIFNYDRIERESLIAISQRSRGTPRIAIRLLKRCIDFAISLKSESLNLKVVEFAMKSMKINDFGLDDNDLKYLNIIYKDYSCGPVGIDSISAVMSDDKNSIEDTVEPFLIKEGFINRTSRGRVLTKKAIDFLNSQN